MRTTIHSAVAGCAIIAGTAGAAHGDELRLGFGYTDVLDQNGAGAVAGQIGYRTGPLWGWERFYLAALVSGTIDADTDIWIGAGLLGGFNLTDRLVLEGSLAPGIYDQGDGADLGGPFELRSQIGLAYQASSEWRIGVAFDHTSNASIYDENPGEEAVWATVGYQF